ncbi:hypothetical protein BDN70DRAFT_601391 [Pholiota conissans]|uniref:GATA-type domain-containing protein n=1 Tax=Pholiota conissans TaxID=109636 RepID=A0A9P5Z3W1_9AGAR|nr:hypothetical protein BDN70DRAFT_601391 [Pholiota conissans]
MVDTDNAKSKREFKKLSKCMGDKLDKEKGRSIEELEAPDFKRNHSTDMIRQRAVEKERNREASQNAIPGTIKRMQFTFSVDQPAQSTPGAPVKKPDTKPSAEFAKRTKTAPAARAQHDEDTVMAEPAANTQRESSSVNAPSSLHFPGLFGNDFGPSALLYAAPTLTNSMNYGEGFHPSSNNDQFSISRPTIELALDDLLFNDDASTDDNSHISWMNTFGISGSTTDHSAPSTGEIEKDEASASSTSSSAAGQQQDVTMSTHAVAPAPAPAPAAAQPIVPSATPSIAAISSRKSSTVSSSSGISTTSSGTLAADDEISMTSDDEDFDQLSPAPSTAKKTSIFKNIPPLSQSVKDILPETVAPSRLSSIYGTRSSTPTSRPTLTLRTQSVSTRSSGPSATATSVNPAVLRGSSSALNSAPGGVKAECSNCGATHTPLWRRGLNDELNCNACGLYCKLHKRPRPKSMRNSHGGGSGSSSEGRAASQAAPRQETIDVMGKSLVDSKSAPLYSDPVRPSVAAQCYNCHTTATPLWRKDDEGKTVCNACGLYYKLHGSARPISMKSDVIRKRSRHDARRAGVPEDTPSASPGVSRRTSPVRDASPTLAPDSTTTMSYEFNDDSETFRNTTSSSELMGALGNPAETTQTTATSVYNSYQLSFPSPYTGSEYLMQLYSLPADALPFAPPESSEIDLAMSPRSPKRRRMSTDSADEPPASAVSFSSFSNDGYSSASSSASHSKRASMEFPFSTYNSNGTINQGPALRGSGNTFWHPPMMPQSTADNDAPLYHAPTIVSSSSGSGASTPSSGTDSSDSGSGSGGGSNEDSPMDYLHPPMAIQDEDSLFSAYLHPPMALPDDSAKGVVGQDGPGSDIDGDANNMHAPMYESYFQ